MDASQESCRNLFDCSCDELNELTMLAKKAGAWGSRLTGQFSLNLDRSGYCTDVRDYLHSVGAGWGGCTVSLVTEAEVPSFIAQVAKSYGPYQGLDKAELEQVIFATKPGSGACGKQSEMYVL